MLPLQNLHTHTDFCDGKNSPRRIIEMALQKGFTSIGFSGHSYMHYAPEHSMSLESTDEYVREIKKLKEEYKDIINIYLGIEFDIFSEIDISPYEYVIGSVHYLKKGSEYVGFDRNMDTVKSVIDKYFDGDGLLYAKEYYQTLSALPEYANIDIIGHFDLISKHADNADFFDMESPQYLRYAFECADSLSSKISFFEVNTGAIARGYRKTPYPSLTLLKGMKKMGYGAVISSDCHDADFLDCSFELSRELLIEAGYKERYILTDKGFCAVAL